MLLSQGEKQLGRYACPCLRLAARGERLHQRRPRVVAVHGRRHRLRADALRSSPRAQLLQPKALELSAQLLTQERALLEEVGSGGGGSGSDACTVDEYTAALEQVVGEKLSLYSRLQGRLAELKRQLADEEALAAKVKPHA